MPLEKARLYQNVVMKLSVLRFMVKTMSLRSKTDLNRHCEPFFRDVLNMVYGYDLKNVNDNKLNEVAIDLADIGRKLCVQVTATSGAGKIKDTIDKFLKHKLYMQYDRLLFLMLVDKKDYRAPFSTDSRFTFKPTQHVLDLDDVLAKAETLALDDLAKLSDYVDSELYTVSMALAPDSLLAKAEKFIGKPPATGARYMKWAQEVKGSKTWDMEFESLLRLFQLLSGLSKHQREFISFMVKHGRKSEFGNKVAMSIQTLQQKLRLNEQEFHSYYRALEAEGILGLDAEERATKFELNYPLRGSGNDAFWMLKDYLETAEKFDQVLVDCDFTILD